MQGLHRQNDHHLLSGLTMHTCFEIPTRGPGLYDFTRSVAQWVHNLEAASGLLTLLIQHTSASLLIQENADGDVQTDLKAFFERLVPDTTDPAMAYLKHTYEGPDDMPAHIKSAMMPVSLSIPVQSARLCLGTWQGIYLFEHRTRPHHRQVRGHFLPDARLLQNDRL